MSIDKNQHYDFYVWPSLGKRFNAQLGEIRQDTEAIFPLVRFSTVYDKDPDCIKDSRVQGFEYGDRTQHNRFRTAYDKSADEWRLQVNKGTEDCPVWVTILSIDDDLNVSNFYIPARLRVKDTTGSVDVFTDTTTFNRDSFYLTLDSQGKPIINHIIDSNSVFVTDGQNIGSGSEVFKQKSSTNLQFRTITQGDNVIITQSDDEIEIAAASSSGGSSAGNAPYIQNATIASNALESSSNHRYNLRPLISHETDSEHRTIIPDEVDFSDGTRTYFYFTAAVQPNHITVVASPNNSVVETVSTPITTWNIIHAFNETPVGVAVFDTKFRRIVPDEIDVSNVNQASITFTSAQAGTALIFNPVGSRKQTFPSALEWELFHNYDTVQVFTQTYDASGKLVIPEKVDKGDPSRIHFYFVEPQAGSVFASTGVNL